MSRLVVDQLNFRYKKSKNNALKDVSCTFEDGCLYTLTGPSGSGKSTLLSMLAGLERPSSGDIQVNGKSLKDMNMDAYRRNTVAMIFQDFQLLPLLTVAENVSYVMEIKGMKKREAMKRARKLLVSLGISDEKHKRYPSHLSGGEQQRVAIARALASGARILLADEPTGNLDSDNSQKIVHILKLLAHKRDYCVIVVTHDLEVAKSSDVVYCLKDGELLGAEDE